MVKGFKKNGKFIPTGSKSKSTLKKTDVRKKQTIGVKEANNILRTKKTLEKGKDYHLYKIIQWESSENDGDTQQWGVIKAKNEEQVEDYIRKEFFTKDADVSNFGGMDNSLSVATPYDENGEELTYKKALSLQEKDEDLVNWVDTGFDIEEDDDQEESFHTIYGGNDFIDLLEPENTGKQSHEVIKEKGGHQQAFNEASGKGFESGNPKNNFNLNLTNGEKMDLYDPKTNPKPTGKRNKSSLDKDKSRFTVRVQGDTAKVIDNKNGNATVVPNRDALIEIAKENMSED